MNLQKGPETGALASRLSGYLGDLRRELRLHYINSPSAGVVRGSARAAQVAFWR